MHYMYWQLYGHFDNFEPPKKIHKTFTPVNHFNKMVSVADEEEYAMGAYGLLYRGVSDIHPSQWL